MRSLDHGFRAARQVLTWAASAMEEQFALLLPATEDADVLLTTVNELGAPTIAEHRRIPHVRIGYAPFLPGDQAPAVQPLQRLPAFANRLLWTAVNAGTSLLFSGPLNDQRKQLGLPRLRNIVEYSAGRSRNLFAIDPLLGPPARGWSFSYDYVGYPFGGDSGPLSPDLDEFLAAGTPPVYVGFGSAGLPDPHAATRMLLSAIAKVGCRAIIAQGWSGLGRGVDLPRDVRLVGSVPHRTLFSRVAGVLHHGGSGTTHNAARAGVPQAIAPQIIDQYYWGHRIHELGLGPAPVAFTHLSERKVVQVLRGLLSPERARQASAVSGLIREGGAEAIADHVERSTRRRAPVSQEPQRLRLAVGD
jgi:vancomycin aglycone glucosyltransferase